MNPGERHQTSCHLPEIIHMETREPDSVSQTLHVVSHDVVSIMEANILQVEVLLTEIHERIVVKEHTHLRKVNEFVYAENRIVGTGYQVIGFILRNTLKVVIIAPGYSSLSLLNMLKLRPLPEPPDN